MSEAVGRDGNKIVDMVNRPGRDAGAGRGQTGQPGILPGLPGRRAGRAGVRSGAGRRRRARRWWSTRAPPPRSASRRRKRRSARCSTRRCASSASRPTCATRLLRQAPGPMVYRIDPAQDVLTARAEGGVAAVRPLIEALWARHFPNDLPEIDAAGAVFAAQLQRRCAAGQDPRQRQRGRHRAGFVRHLCAVGLQRQAPLARDRAAQAARRRRRRHRPPGGARIRLADRHRRAGRPAAGVGRDRALPGRLRRARADGLWPLLYALRLRRRWWRWPRPRATRWRRCACRPHWH